MLCDEFSAAEAYRIGLVQEWCRPPAGGAGDGDRPDHRRQRPRSAFR
ncbi:MAG: hypothetical protein WDM85_00875 [Caulobacteraceae bacterium]